MKAVVVYESLWGNTQEIAEAVADGLRGKAEVAVLPVADAVPDAIAGADLLVAGGPTHVHGMSSKLSRAAAAEAAAKEPDDGSPPNVEGPPLGDWIDRLVDMDDVVAAAFDTRLDKPRMLTGSATTRIAKRLRRRGLTVSAEESFLVGGREGPLLEGELERARAWGADLALLPGVASR